MTDTRNVIQTHEPLRDQTMPQIKADVNNLLDIC